MTGKLYLIATPIGNLEDITLRAVRLLGEFDLVAAEDTRNSGRLLKHFNIKKPLISYYEHNKKHREGYLLEELQEGKDIALRGNYALRITDFKFRVICERYNIP